MGPYTSAAIGSIAFNDRAAVVDGNVVGGPILVVLMNNLIKSTLAGWQRGGWASSYLWIACFINQL